MSKAGLLLGVCSRFIKTNSLHTTKDHEMQPQHVSFQGRLIECMTLQHSKTSCFYGIETIELSHMATSMRIMELRSGHLTIHGKFSSLPSMRRPLKTDHD